MLDWPVCKVRHEASTTALRPWSEDNSRFQAPGLNGIVNEGARGLDATYYVT